MDKSGSGLFKGYDCEEIAFLVGVQEIPIGFLLCKCLKKGAQYLFQLRATGHGVDGYTDAASRWAEEKHDVVFHFHQFKQTPEIGAA